MTMLQLWLLAVIFKVTGLTVECNVQFTITRADVSTFTLPVPRSENLSFFNIVYYFVMSNTHLLLFMMTGCGCGFFNLSWAGSSNTDISGLQITVAATHSDSLWLSVSLCPCSCHRVCFATVFLSPVWARFWLVFGLIHCSRKLFWCFLTTWIYKKMLKIVVVATGIIPAPDVPGHGSPISCSPVWFQGEPVKDL